MTFAGIYFREPGMLMFLWLIPVLILFFWLFGKQSRNAVGKLASRAMQPILTGRALPGTAFTRKFLLLVGVLFLVLASARPQFGKKPVILKREGRDIVFLLDTSLSMLAQDIKPDRLSRARFEIKSLLERLEGDRVALVPFAGEASVLCPLTTDYSALGLFLETVDTDYISRPGTNISDALKVGEEVFDERQSQYKVMILITDGEQLEGDALETARKLKEENIHLYAIGIGSPDGVPIALENQNGGVEHKRDSKGDIVISKLGEKLLVELAAAGGGKYYRAGSQSLELEHIFDDIQKIEKRLIDSQDFTLFRDRFQWPLSVALFALILEVLLWDLRAGGKLSFSGKSGKEEDDEKK